MIQNHIHSREAQNSFSLIHLTFRDRALFNNSVHKESIRRNSRNTYRNFGVRLNKYISFKLAYHFIHVQSQIFIQHTLYSVYFLQNLILVNFI